MELSNPSFIAQLKEIPTAQSYQAEKIFTDHYSDISYINLHRIITSNEIVLYQNAFELYIQNSVVKVRHSHEDNRIFQDKLFIKEVTDERQTISFCRINTHFQNVKADKSIRDLK